MPPPEPAEMVSTAPSRRRLPSPIWLVPILALVVTLGIAWNAYNSRGKLIEVEFADATGITPGETSLKFREVNVGKVESVTFTQDLTKVMVGIRVDKDVASYIDSDAEFWIVRPEVSAQGISRLDTVLSGVFIEGSWDAEIHDDKITTFVGLNRPPLATQQTRGTLIVLSTDSAEGFTDGAPILFRGIQVGKMQNIRLSDDDESVLVDALIEAPYDQRLTTSTVFWDTSGFSLSLGAQGVSFNVNSLASLLQGGVEFATLTSGGEPVERGHVFRLNPDESTARNSLFAADTRYDVRLTMLVDNSVRGLEKGADVEFQGLIVGKVTDIAVHIDSDGIGPTRNVKQAITIALTPERLGLPADAPKDEVLAFLTDRVADGLRARVASAGILGTRLIVELVDIENAAPAEIALDAEPYPIIPSVPGNISDFTASAQGVMTRISNLPIEKLLSSATNMMDSVTAIAASPEARGVPEKVQELLNEGNAMLNEIRETAAEMRILATELKDSGAMAGLGGMVDEATAAAASIKVAIADVPTMIADIETAAESISKVEFAAIGAEAQGILQDLRAMLGTEDAAQLPRNLSDTLKSATGVLDELRDGNAAGSLNDALASAKTAADEVAVAVQGLPELADRLEQLAARADSVIAAYGDRSAFNAEAINAMRELKRATAAFGSLARTIERNPRAFILGR